MPRGLLDHRVPPRTRQIPDNFQIDPTIQQMRNQPHYSAIDTDHPLLTGRLFLTLPKSLMDLVEAELNAEVLDSDVWQLDRRLATDLARHPDRVGYLDGLPVQFSYLHEAQGISGLEDWRKSTAWKESRWAAIQEAIEGRSNRFRMPCRGYCGWLMTNPLFLNEHDEILSRWSGDIYQRGIPGSSRFYLMQQQNEPDVANPTASGEFVNDFRAFYQRWRLTCLEAPYLPSPLTPQVPAPLPSKNNPLTGTTLFLPDTFPVPSRDELRDMLEESLRAGKKEDHLQEWHEKVRSDKTSKNSFDRFARLFALQHYWMVMHYRHGPLFKGNIGKLERVMERFLTDDELAESSSIHDDLIFIRKRLGADWFEAPRISDQKLHSLTRDI